MLRVEKENKIFVHDKQILRILRILISLLVPLLDVYYYILLLIANLRRKKIYHPKKYHLSICAIFKNEEVSLKEWIEYHLLLGVDHFYLYNNCSTDNFDDILVPYIKDGIVDLIDWRYTKPRQFEAFEDCFYKKREETKWFAFIDLDEFICPIKDLNIQEWLNKYNYFPSVVAYWKMFGTSGQIEHDNNKLIIEQYTVSWDRYYDIGKCFFNSDFEVYRFDRHHVMPAKVRIFSFDFYLPPINEFKKFVILKNNRIGLFKNKEDFTIQINHYTSKAYMSFVKSKVEGGLVWNHHSLAGFYWHENKNISSDFKIWRFMIAFKLRLQINK